MKITWLFLAAAPLTMGCGLANADLHSRKSAQISFRNHILPILTKAGCNGGSCHGAAVGKGGLKLTLRGFDAAWDYNVLTRQSLGRRVVAGNPMESLIVLKAAMFVGHGGGERIKKNGADFKILCQWIESGAPGPQSSDATISKLEVSPPQATLLIGQSQQFTVRAKYSDGHIEDVTRWVKFGSSASQIASVDDSGYAKSAANGEAAITVWFSSKVTFARVVSPFPQSTPAIKFTSNVNLIDRHVVDKLNALHIPASDICSDQTFVRRAYLDATGTLPLSQEALGFTADQRPDKRQILIDRLLSSSEFVDYWSYKWCDLLLVSSKKLSGPALTSFYNWIKLSVADNKSWGKFAQELLTARGSNLDNGAANYFVLHKEPIDLTETTTQAFLGMSVQCAHCHNHPMEKWTQNDYYQMANLLSRVRLKNGDRAGEIVAITSQDGDINHPRLSRPLPPKPLDGPAISLEDNQDRREALVNWLIKPTNPYFAKAIINRIWKNYMGRGLVESEDDLRLTNPASNQALFDALALDFVRNGFDTKRLMRQIMTSDAYQRSSNPVGINAQDDRYYSHYLVRRLPAEVLLDAISNVTGVSTDFPGYPRNTRALQLRDSQIASYFLTAFGRPERAQTCSCERQQEPNVLQALHLTNGDTINSKLRSASSKIESLTAGDASPEEILNALYISALARKPTSAEIARILPELVLDKGTVVDSARKQMDSRRQSLEDLFWAVLTDNEFLFNH